MKNKVTYNELLECTEELRKKIEETRARLNAIYMSKASYEEKMKVSEELDLLILEAMKQMSEARNI